MGTRPSLGTGLHPLGVPLALAGALFGLSFWPDVASAGRLALDFRIAAGLLAGATALVGLHSRGKQRVLSLRFVPVRAHWVQAGVQLGLYTAWARHWDGVVEHVPHILAQFLFYYALDILSLGYGRIEDGAMEFTPAAEQTGG